MKVYRLEHASLPSLGPFNRDIVDEFQMMFTGRKSVTEGQVTPADAAQTIAVMSHEKGPYAMPSILDDGPSEEKIQGFMGYATQPAYGFHSVAEYKEWFRTTEIRRALFTRVSIKISEASQIAAGYNDIQMRVYEVPKDKLIEGEHQVLFDSAFAKKGEIISRDQLI